MANPPFVKGEIEGLKSSFAAKKDLLPTDTSGRSSRAGDSRIARTEVTEEASVTKTRKPAATLSTLYSLFPPLQLRNLLA